MLSACLALIDSKSLKKEFEKFYAANRRLGMSKAYSLLGNVSLAEDALSESFFRLAKCFQKVHNLPSHKLQAYFVIIVRNVSVDMLRHENRVDSLPYDDELEQGIGLDEELPEADNAKLAECIALLSENSREILYLKYELGLETGELAQTLGISSDAARQRVRYAKRRLRQLLERE